MHLVSLILLKSIEYTFNIFCELKDLTVIPRSPVPPLMHGVHSGVFQNKILQRKAYWHDFSCV